MCSERVVLQCANIHLSQFLPLNLNLLCSLDLAGVGVLKAQEKGEIPCCEKICAIAEQHKEIVGL